MNPYSDTHKNLSTTELLEIINNPQDYEALAVTSAQEELRSRNLTQEELQNETVKFKQIEEKKVAQKEYLQQQKNSITENVIHYFLVLLHGKSKQRSLLTIINGISILIILNAVKLIFDSFFMHGQFYFSYAGMPGYFLLTVIVPVILLVLISLQLRKQTLPGWIGANIVLFISLVGVMSDFILRYDYSNNLNLMYIPKPDPIKTSLQTTLISAGIFFLNNKQIYPLFKITTKTRNIVFITLSVLFAVAILYAFV